MLITSSPPYIPTPPFPLSSSEFVNVSALLSALAPAPSAAAHHHEGSLSAIVGGGVASVLALAATAILVVAMHGRAGLARLLAPLGYKLFSSCVLGALLRRSGQSLRIKSLRDIFRSKRHGRQKSKDQADDNEGSSRRTGNHDIDHGSFLSRIFSGRTNSTRAVSKRDSLPQSEQPPSTTSVPVEDIVREQVEQLQTSIHGYVVTTVNQLVELHIEKAKEELRQLSVHQSTPETQTYAACASVFLSVADTVIDDLKSFNEEDGKADEANAISNEASTSQRVEEVWIQPLETALSIVEEAVKIGVDIASASSPTVTQEAELLEEQPMIYSKRQGTRWRPADHDIEADEPGQQEGVTRMMLLNDAGYMTSEKIYEVQKSTFTELQVRPEETLHDPAPQKVKTGEGTVAPASNEQKSSEGVSGNNHGLALVPTTDTGGIAANNVGRIEMAMVPIPPKEMLPVHSKLRRSSKRGKWARNEVMLKVASSKKHNQAGHGIVGKDMQRRKSFIARPTKAIVPHWRTKRVETHQKLEGKDAIPKASKDKCKRPWNLGHLSLSCEMSARHLGFFTSFTCGGAYGGSDQTFNNDHNNHFNEEDINIHQHDNNANGVDAPNKEELHITQSQVCVPNDHDNLMHHQQHAPPSKLLLAQSVARSDAPVSTVQSALMSTTSHSEFIEKPLKSSGTDDYGSPFDGIV